MPKLSRKETVDLVARHAMQFANLLDKDITVALGPQSFDTHLHTVALARQADVRNLPEKVLASGVRYTPALMCLDCGEDGKLFVVLEDIEHVFLRVDGVDLVMREHTVKFIERESCM